MDRRKLFVTLLVWMLAGAMLWFVLRDLDFAAVGNVLGRLTGLQIVILLLVNTFIIFLFGARWWLILRAQGHRFPLIRASAYRLAAFGVSYFTPGPHVGGEPLQVYLAVKHEGVPADTATASVILDKIFELSANFAFLAFGVSILLSGGLLEDNVGILGMSMAFSLLALPIGYLYFLARGRRPLSQVFDSISLLIGSKAFGKEKVISWLDKVGILIRTSEQEAITFVNGYKKTFALAVLLSGVVWAALVLEYVLAIRFLGLALDIKQVISVITSARLAILLPLPGGLGALEAALVLVTRLIGQGAALGAGLSLLIRVRDIMFGLIGLWLGRRLTIVK